MDSVRHVIGILLVITLPPAALFWLVIHPFARLWRRLGALATYVLVLTPLVGIGAFLYQRRNLLLGSDLGTNWILLGAGVGLYVVSIYIESQCRRHLRFSTLVGMPEVARTKERGGLITEGIYGKMRHPRYLSVVTGMMGFAAIVNYVGVYVMVGLLLPTMYLLISLEERELLHRFGREYRDYQRRVPRILPRLRSR